MVDAKQYLTTRTAFDNPHGKRHWVKYKGHFNLTSSVLGNLEIRFIWAPILHEGDLSEYGEEKMFYRGGYDDIKRILQGTRDPDYVIMGEHLVPNEKR